MPDCQSNANPIFLFDGPLATAQSPALATPRPQLGSKPNASQDLDIA